MRVLVTGLSTYWGGRLAQALESDPRVEAIIGIDRRPPKFALERTEYVEVADAHTLIQRIVQAAEIDTVVDTRLVVDSTVTSPRRAHENNVIGTMNILAACSGPDTTVRRFVFKSSAHYYGAEQDDPAFFTEDMERPHPPTTRIERDIVEAESAVRDFAASQGERTKVCILRFTHAVGPRLRTAYMDLLSRPFLPAILGFDPRIQLIHSEELVGILEHAVRNDLEGVYNGAPDGVLVWSEIASLLGKPVVPVLPPWGTRTAAGLLERTGLPLPDEVLNLLRFGRGLDNRKLKATGYRYRYTTREAVLKLAEQLRVAPLQRTGEEAYRYEREVEAFLRYSPSVRRDGRSKHLVNVAPGQRAGVLGAAPGALEDLEPGEIAELVKSMEAEDLEQLREFESANAARPEVLRAIDAALSRS
jgi:UDP-glucose 4-epimerase